MSNTTDLVTLKTQRRIQAVNAAPVIIQAYQFSATHQQALPGEPETLIMIGGGCGVMIGDKVLVR